MRFNDAKVFDQRLSFLFHAFLAGPLLLYCISYLRTIDGSVLPTVQESSTTVKAGVAFASGILVLFAFYFYKKELQVARNLSTLNEKLSRLFKASLIHYAFIEVASFASVVAFFLTHEHIYTAVYVGILFLMSMNRPVPDKYIRDLYLKGEEREIILYKKQIPE